MEDERKQTIRTIKECLMDYVGPIYICGKVFDNPQKFNGHKQGTKSEKQCNVKKHFVNKKF